MKKPRKSLLAIGALIIFVFAFSPRGFSSATNVYVTPNGSATGGCPAGTTAAPNLTPAKFNATSAWGSGSGQIGPGTTILLCGTFTGAAGSTELTFQGSGTSGNPITLLFDTNAQLNAPYWAVSPNGGCGGAICIYGLSWITINGGSNGIIQNTANGDNLGNQAGTEAVEAMGCNNCTIENLTIANMFVQVSNGSPNIDDTNMRCISIGGSSNVTITNNTIHDAGWCLFQNFHNGDANITISNNTLYNITHGWMLASQVAGGSSGPFNFYGNHIYGYANWDTASDAYHHDGIHCFTSQTNGAGAHLTSLNIYNNYFGPPVGTTVTAHIFLEGGSGSGATPCADSTSKINIYNNVLVGDQPINNGLAGLFSGNIAVYNNTFLSTFSSDGVCVAANSVVGGVVFKNNAVSGCNQLMAINDHIPFTSDYNVYGAAGSNAFVCNGSFFTADQYASWQSCIAGDSHSTYHASLGLSSLGVPASGSAVIGVGTNLTSLGIAALNSDTSAGNSRTPTPRPSTGAWDVGAYNANGSAAPSSPAPPTGLTGVVK